MNIRIFKATELLKSKYTRRTGGPGNYKYEYGQKKGRSTAKPAEFVPDKDSLMYQRAYDDATIRFSYIPDFKTKEEQMNWAAGLKAGNAAMKKEDKKMSLAEMGEKSKFIWGKTRKDYIAEMVKLNPQGLHQASIASGFHLMAVASALRSGEKVPANVLKDYSKLIAEIQVEGRVKKP